MAQSQFSCCDHICFFCVLHSVSHFALPAFRFLLFARFPLMVIYVFRIKFKPKRPQLIGLRRVAYDIDRLYFPPFSLNLLSFSSLPIHIEKITLVFRIIL